MISEGSCDTEDWRILIIFHNTTVFTVFLTNKCSLGVHKRLLSKTSYRPQTFVCNKYTKTNP